jgi:hypothetical protein
MNAVRIMRDALQRIVVLREALEAGDTGFAYEVAAGLEDDIAGKLHELGDGVVRFRLDDFNDIPCDPDDPGLAAA